ncbi:S24 family peptidase [Neorhizobium sp. JUb45]|uniref:S24 family peptidase n=1 Tax=Neorhizobium sp. JUb45 TaxID=2485113 RepID=UPI00104FF6FA|nr:S24 family peptidase [Neorhizobium sp. JUb45]TCR07219.1 hypothetical protein EDF70_1011190 [Neorhizobium sp. JUb45]
MPEKKSRFAQMLIDKQRERNLTDRETAGELGEQQQTFSTWKRYSLPRLPRPKLASFLNISEEKLAEFVEEARHAAVDGKIAPLTAFAKASTYGRVSDRKDGKFKFDSTRKAVPDGRYAVIVDTKLMEPVFKVGCKVWLDPTVWPKPGNDVIAHSRGGLAWIGRLEELGETARLSRYAGDPVTVSDLTAVHVIVLAERV